MAKKSSPPPLAGNSPTIAERIRQLQGVDAVGGVSGPGRWLISEFAATAPFSLKISSATSSVGKTLVIPTPYSIKMALVDAGFRAGLSDDECARVLRALTSADVRVAVPAQAIVTHTFVKVRQESREADPLRPYSSTIAYREIAHVSSSSSWAFDLATVEDNLAEHFAELFAHISYVGKRGSFVRFVSLCRASTLGSEYTQPIARQGSWSPPARAHIVALDDFGPDADLETLSSFTQKRVKRDQHRRFVETIIPLGVVNTGPGFTHYSRD
jgi:hypothetical protein